MIPVLFVSDLHSSINKYEHLFANIVKLKPQAVFIAGDLLGSASLASTNQIAGLRDFLYDYLVVNLEKLKKTLSRKYPRIFVIPGNDDSRLHEASLLDISASDLLTYVSQRIVDFKGFQVSGYAFIPPTPFLNKDWEKYDVSRFVDVGCVSPEEGFRSFPVDLNEIRYYTIKKDLEILYSDTEMNKMICMFHAPPYETSLDRADLDGKFADHAPVDVHVGSIAVKDFIINRKPYLTLHGHVHESTRLTGIWQQKLGRTIAFQGASERGDLRLIRFDLDDPEKAELVY
jgi:uncharacterized protein